MTTTVERPQPPNTAAESDGQPSASVELSEWADCEGESSALLPAVVVADRSGSMAHADAIGVLNRELQALHDGLRNHPIAGAITRVAVVSFADDARVEMPMTELIHVDRMPLLQAAGRTSYRAAAELLTRELPGWIDQLKFPAPELKNTVYSPTLFFITDGQPTDPDQAWRSAYDTLTDRGNRWRPHVVVFGVGDASADVIKWMPRGQGKAYLAQTGGDVTSNLGAIVKSIMNSLVATSAQIAAGPTGQTVAVPVPTQVPGLNPI